MTQRPRPRLPLVGVLSIAFVLLPAAGIAYLGAISYQEDRGLVAAELDEHYQSAVTIAAAIERTIEDTLGALDKLESQLDGGVPIADDQWVRVRSAHPLAAYPFIIDAQGQLVFPAREPLRRRDPERGDFISRAPRTCPEPSFDACIRAIRTARRRLRQLQQARRRELGRCTEGDDHCAPTAKDLDAARRTFAGLTRFDDTGPDALLGLVRLAIRAGDRKAALIHYQTLRERYGGRLDDDGVAYSLLAALGRAELMDEAEELVELYRSLLLPTFEAPTAMLEQLADRVAADLHRRTLDPATRAHVDALDRRLREGRAQARFAAALASDVEDVSRTAGPRVRGRPALTAPERTLLYRRQKSGRVIGFVVDRPLLMLEARRSREVLASLAPGTHPVVERPGDAARRAPYTRTLASTGFGPILPHLSLALAHDRSLPDPLDEIVAARGKRHLAITGGLVALLLLGLLATIRGAARERELARLKSDLVSTVSHELKTPLTSIRMFGEMLQQGVAGADRERESRYHEIIVKESQRLGLLIANLLDYSQIERGTRHYTPQPTRAVDIARDAVETFERFREEPVDITLVIESASAQAADRDTEVPDDGPELSQEQDHDVEGARILVDREVLVQSLLNLLGNAVKYGEPPIVVTVASTASDQVRIAVADHGPGIPAAEQDRIFREFYRAPSAYSSGVEGTGLGLALVKRHVQAQGGTVEVASEAGKGAIFTIHFPRSR